MSKGKRYFWLKLYDDFFGSKRIKKLRRLAGGDTYTIIYLKLQLVAMKSDGVIEMTGLEEDIADELSLEIDESPDDIKVTLAYLLSCGLAETSDNVNFYFPYAVANTGSETSAAERVRNYRKKQKVLQCNTDVTQVKQNCNGEIDIEKEIDIDNKKRKNNKKEKVRHKYGDFKNVLLTDEQYAKLQMSFPDDYEKRINRCSYYCESKGVTYKNYLATIQNWARKEQEEKVNNNGCSGTNAYGGAEYTEDDLYK